MSIMEPRRVTTEFQAKQVHREPYHSELFRVGDQVALLHSEGAHDYFVRIPATQGGRPEEYVTTDFVLKTEPMS
jgi:hypothetical protein